MKRLLSVFLLAALTLTAQNAFQKPAPVQKLFILKYADPAQLVDLLHVFDASVHMSPAMHALAIQASPETMAAIEEAIKKLDVPPQPAQNVDLRVDLLLASDTANPAGEAVPKDLDSVITQLKKTFSFKSYALLDVLSTRTRTGQQVNTNSTGGTMEIGERPVAVPTSLQVRSITVATDGSVRIDGLHCSSRVPMANGAPGQFQYMELGVQTDLDIKDGQKVVVGRMGIGRDQALFLVMTVKIL